MCDRNSVLMPGNALSVTIAMLTFRRTHLLTGAIAALVEACAGYPRAEVLIVDNDPEASARDVVQDAATSFPRLAIRYLHEPRAGIAAARNCALDGTRSDVLVFIDDDEVPTSRWLEKMMSMYCRKLPTAVIGPVRHEFEVVPSPWIVAGGFFQRRREEDGAPIGEGASNNMLLDMQRVRALGIRFDDRLGLTGGEDSLFTKQLVKCGGQIIWCDEAEVVDLVPRRRISGQWVMRRAFRLGNTPPRVDLLMAVTSWSRLKTRVRYSVRGLIRVAIGSSRIAWGAVRFDQRHRARGSRTVARGAGMLAGALGYQYTEYARRAVPRTAGPTSVSQGDVANATE
jgi:glycosyltransferase involved in cell wall biosynthesis